MVLMDIRIEGVNDGIRTASILRTRYDVPVIYLTSNDDAATLARALVTDPAGYLVKPFNEHSLRTTIEVALRRHGVDLVREQAHDMEKKQLEQEVVAISRVASRHRRQATIDPLTGLGNRRHLEFVLKRAIDFGLREHHAVGVIMLDVDRFKRLNDTFGHAMGDAALSAIGELLRTRIRTYDVACRYGGEEFVVVAPGEESAGVLALAEALRTSLENLVVTCDNAAVRVTASFGVSSFPVHGVDSEALLKAADVALYRAKADGRNRVVGAPVVEL
jgi:diguanylate cyclase (GGDEF)-like protein